MTGLTCESSTAIARRVVEDETLIGVEYEFEAEDGTDPSVV